MNEVPEASACENAFVLQAPLQVAVQRHALVRDLDEAVVLEQQCSAVSLNSPRQTTYLWNASLLVEEVSVLTFSAAACVPVSVHYSLDPCRHPLLLRAPRPAEPLHSLRPFQQLSHTSACARCNDRSANDSKTRRSDVKFASTQKVDDLPTHLQFTLSFEIFVTVIRPGAGIHVWIMKPFIPLPLNFEHFDGL